MGGEAAGGLEEESLPRPLLLGSPAQETGEPIATMEQLYSKSFVSRNHCIDSGCPQLHFYWPVRCGFHILHQGYDLLGCHTHLFPLISPRSIPLSLLPLPFSFFHFRWHLT